MLPSDVLYLYMLKSPMNSKLVRSTSYFIEKDALWAQRLFPVLVLGSTASKSAAILAKQSTRQGSLFPPLELPNGTAPHDEQIGITVGSHLADLLLGITNDHLRLHLHLQETIPNQQTRSFRVTSPEPVTAVPLHFSQSKS